MPARSSGHGLAYHSVILGWRDLSTAGRSAQQWRMRLTLTQSRVAPLRYHGRSTAEGAKGTKTRPGTDKADPVVTA
jgi:hypothetical protein